MGIIRKGLTISKTTIYETQKYSTVAVDIKPQHHNYCKIDIYGHVRLACRLTFLEENLKHNG